MKNWKRILSSILVFCLLAGFAPAAFADEDTVCSDPVFFTSGEDGEMTETLGGVSVVSPSDLYVTALTAYATNGDVTVNVKGDVSLEHSSPSAEGEPSHNGTGVQATAYGETGNATVNVEGDVSVDSAKNGRNTGIDQFTSNTSWTYDSESGNWNEVEGTAEGTSSVSVGGDVTVSSVNDAAAAHLEAGDGGTVQTTVSGNLEAEGSGWVVGMEASAEAGSDVSAVVQGNVSASEKKSDESEAYSQVEGISTRINDESGTIDIKVEGNVSAEGETGGYVSGVSQSVSGNKWEYDPESGTSTYVPGQTQGSSSVSVEGNVTVSSGTSSTGVSTNISDGGSGHAEIGGSVSADSNGNSNGIIGYARDSSVELSVDGDVTANGGSSYAVTASSSGKNGSADISVGGNVEAGADSESHGFASAVQVESAGGSATSAVIEGDISAVSSSENGEARAVWAQAAADGSTDLTVNGDVSAKADASTALYVNGNSKTTVTVDGDVSAEATGKPSSSDEEVYYLSDAVGVHIMQYTTTGDIAVDINGSVSAKSSGDSAIGTQQISTTSPVYEYDPETETFVEVGPAPASSAENTLHVKGDITADGAVYAQGSTLVAANSAASSLEVVGNITANGEADASALAVTAENGGSVKVKVTGDVSSNHDGLVVSGDADGKIQIMIDGTLSGEDAAVKVAGEVQDALTLVLWKADLDKDGHVVAPEQLTEENVPAEMTAEELEEQNAKLQSVAEAVEANILYIIKLLQPSEGATLSLSGTTQSDGYDVAKEGDNVRLLIDVDDGYSLNAAYNGDGEKIALEKDAEGNYFLIVPRGGGVYLSADLSLIPAPVAPVTPVVQFVKKAIARAETKDASSGDSADEQIVLTVKDDKGESVALAVEIIFYNDKTFVVTINGGESRLSGVYKLVDSVLTLVMKDGTEVAINDEGVFVIDLGNGNTLEIKLDQATIDALTKSLK